MEDDVQQRTMNAQFTVVLDETKFAEPIHEEAHTGAGCTDHLSQCLLGYLRDHHFRLALLAKACEKQEGAGQALFAGVKQLINQVLLNTNIAGKQVSYEYFREGSLSV